MQDLFPKFNFKSGKVPWQKFYHESRFLSLMRAPGAYLLPRFVVLQQLSSILNVIWNFYFKLSSRHLHGEREHYLHFRLELPVPILTRVRRYLCFRAGKKFWIHAKINRSRLRASKGKKKPLHSLNWMRWGSLTMLEALHNEEPGGGRWAGRK